ncbi:MAG: pirin family protein [Micavibrio sp.]|nr:pirin family protein [Micavibrio sp.]
MQKVIYSQDRGETSIDWLQSHHSFSFGNYYDPRNMGFGPLRVINEDYVAPGTGFGMHGHANMEIITYVLSGQLEHKDNLGNGSQITPGDVQVMSAGKGIMHSEFNPSGTAPVHLLQIWIMPEETGTAPGYQQKTFEAGELENALRLVVSPDKADGSLAIRQQARLWIGRLDQEKSVSLEIDKSKKYWFQVARGNVSIRGEVLGAGDALAVDGEAGLAEISASSAAELVVFELPH